MIRWRPLRTILILFCFNIFFVLGQVAAAPRENPGELSLGTTHLLPSPYVIPGGTMIVGTNLGYGLFNVADVSTNLFYDFIPIYNGTLKINLLGGTDAAFAVFGTYTAQTVNTVDTLGNTVKTTVTTTAPGAIFSYRLADSIVAHTGADFVNMNPSVSKSNLLIKTAYIHGTTLYQEFGFGLGNSVALALGGTYDATYDYWGAGISFHISGLQLGAHYYLNVSEGALVPIIGVGYGATY